MSQVNICIIGENRIAESLFRSWEETSRSNVSWNEEKNLKKAHLIVETTNVDKERKKNVLQMVERLSPPSATIVTTSMGWTATEIASWLARPERVLGFGAFANVEQAPSIEAALPLQADSSHVTIVQEQLQAIGKEIELVEDEPGLVFPRVLSMIINEAAFALMEQTAGAEDIDMAMKKGTNYPLGPLEWAEEVGIDNVYAILQGLFEHLGEERYRPASLIKKLVYANWTGTSAGKGFYHYQKRQSKELAR